MVPEHGASVVDQAPARGTPVEGKVDVLLAVEIARVESTDGLERVPPHEQTRRGQRRDLAHRGGLRPVGIGAGPDGARLRRSVARGEPDATVLEREIREAAPCPRAGGDERVDQARAHGRHVGRLDGLDEMAEPVRSDRLDVVVEEEDQVPPARPDGGVVGVRVRLVPLVADHGHREAGGIGGQHGGRIVGGRIVHHDQLHVRVRTRRQRGQGPAQVAGAIPGQHHDRDERADGPGGHRRCRNEAGLGRCGIARDRSRRGRRGRRRAPADRAQPPEPTGERHAGPDRAAGLEGRVLAPKRRSLGLDLAELGPHRPDRRRIGPPEGPLHLDEAPELLDLRRGLVGRQLLLGARGRAGAAVHHVSRDAERPGIKVSSIPLRGGAPGAVAAYVGGTR